MSICLVSICLRTDRPHWIFRGRIGREDLEEGVKKCGLYAGIYGSYHYSHIGSHI